jgi:hypothetical protein
MPPWDLTHKKRMRMTPSHSGGVGVIFLLFSRRDVHAYKVPSNCTRKFHGILYMGTLCPYFVSTLAL